MSKNFSYLVDKAPSELHEDLSAYINEELDIAVDPKAVQLILAMHGTWQKTDRVVRRRRTVESIAKGGATTALRRGWAPDDLASEEPKAVEPEVVEEPKPAPAKKTTRRRAPAKKLVEAVAAE